MCTRRLYEVALRNVKWSFVYGKNNSYTQISILCCIVRSVWMYQKGPFTQCAFDTCVSGGQLQVGKLENFLCNCLMLACLRACVCGGGLPDVIGRWRLISVQLSNKFGYCLSWTVSLGRYEPSSPTKELYDMRQTLIVLIRHLEGALQLAGSFYVFNIFLTFNETLPATRPIS